MSGDELLDQLSEARNLLIEAVRMYESRLACTIPEYEANHVDGVMLNSEWLKKARHVIGED